MGRTRRKDTHLPKRLFFRHGAYYYVAMVDGEYEWMPLGRDETAAVSKAADLNGMKAAHRKKALSLARQADFALREQIMARDGYACVYCGSTEALGVDHIIPYSKGGATAPFNLVVACLSCNAKKGDGDPREVVIALGKFREELLARAIAILDSGAKVGQPSGESSVSH